MYREMSRPMFLKGGASELIWHLKMTQNLMTSSATSPPSAHFVPSDRRVLAMSYIRYGYSQRILGSHSICQAKAPPLSKVDYLTMLSYALLLFVHPIFANEILFVGQR